MNERLAKILRSLGYNHERTDIVKVDNLRHRAKYNAVAIKIRDGRVFIAQHLGASEADAEDKLVKMLERP